MNVRFDGPDGPRIVWSVGDPVGSEGCESAQLRLLEHLLPHVHRSVLIRQALAAADALGAELAGLLDNERIGAVQLDRGGRVPAADGPARRARIDPVRVAATLDLTASEAQVPRPSNADIRIERLSAPAKRSMT